MVLVYHKKRWNPFARSNEGRNIYFLSEKGYKFADYQKDLTALQERFLITSSNVEADIQKDPSSIEKRNAQQRVLEKAKLKRKELEKRYRLKGD